MGYRMSLYMESGFDPTWLYGLTNEHRAMFSKLTNFALFKLNNLQWDPYLTMVLDAFLWGAIGVFMICLGFRQRDKINPWFFSILIIVLWTYPLSLFNTLSTIQTYLYYMMIFVLCGFWLLIVIKMVVWRIICCCRLYDNRWRIFCASRCCRSELFFSDFQQRKPHSAFDNCRCRWVICGLRSLPYPHPRLF